MEFLVSVSSVAPLMYKIALRSIESCKNPDPPYEKDPMVTLNVEPYNKSGLLYFRGNFTIRENLRGYYWKIKTGIEKTGNVIKYINNFKKLTCKSMIPRVILAAANVRYDDQKCEYYKGTYFFNKMDLNKLDPGAYYFPIKEIGESLVYFGFYSTNGSSFCLFSRYVLKPN